MKVNDNIKPPRWGMHLLEWLCKEELLEEIEGDLYQEFQNRVERFGERKAKLIYNFQIFSFLRPFALKKIKITQIQNPIPMLIHYLKIALRSFWQQKLSATINVLSLSLGIGCAILIFLFIQNEFSFDAFHKNVDQIYRINRVINDKDGNYLEGQDLHPMPFAPTIKAQMPDIQEVTRIYDTDDYIKRGDYITQEHYYFADPSFFKIFSFEFLQGNPQTALKDNKSIVITENIAKKFFGKEDPMGKTIAVHFSNIYLDLDVSGVIKDPPSNSTLNFELVLPIEAMLFLGAEANLFGMGDWYKTTWEIGFLSVFATISEDANLQSLHKKMPDFAAQYYEKRDYFKDLYGVDSYYNYQFQPLKEVHFDNVIASGLKPPSQKKYSYILGGIGLMVLLIACINFTILAIGRSSYRAKEIGIRKVIGAKRNQVANQFLGESFLLSFFGLIFGLLMAYAALPGFSKLANRSFSLSALLSVEAILFFVGVTIVSGLVAGVYPAILISAFRPVQSIKNQLKLGRTNFFTNALVSTQFVLSIVLVIVTLVMTDQLRFLKNKDLGFDDELLLVIKRNNIETTNFFPVYKNELKNNPKIVSVSATKPAFSHGYVSSNFNYEGKTIPYNVFYVEENYLKTTGIQLATGRDFNANITSDTTNNIIVNEAFIKELGWKEDPIGKKILGLDNMGYKDPTVIGVVKDFNYESLERAVNPVWMMLSREDEMNDLLVRIRPEDIQGTIKKLEDVWKSLAPNIPFTYSFIDERMAALYKDQERWNSIVKSASIIAIFIAFFGMFGLVALSVAGRAKEMSIRKVFGASMQDIAYAISNQFAKLVLIAGLIASPIAWYLANEWLKGFAYHVDVKITLFLLAFGLILIVFIMTLLYHIIKAARRDPIDALRSE